MKSMSSQKMVRNIVIGVVVLFTVLYVGVNIYRSRTPKLSEVAPQLSVNDRNQLKVEMEKVVRNDLINKKVAKINSIEISDPMEIDAEHLLIPYQFSYDDNSDSQGEVNHDMKAQAHLQKIAEGWQIENITPSDESLKFTTPIVIQTKALGH
jgi:hypothetical protein